MSSEQTIDGPFLIGDRVVIYSADGLCIVGRGTIDGAHPPVDDEYFYDVAGDGRWDKISELLLDEQL